MTKELNLRFPDEKHVIVRLDSDESGELPFKNPLRAKDRKDIHWYLEVYGVRSLDDPDDSEAARIAAQLPVWGKALFDAAFHDRAAQRLFNTFQDSDEQARLLTVSAEHPSILALPWELLHDSANGGVFLFNETPRISVRRRVAGATGGRPPLKVNPKDRLHLLFVVSRPSEAGFLDPRADAGAVLDALDEHGPGRFTWEFLRPATIDALTERLEDEDQPPVDVIHFDGHGVFDRHGGLPEAVARRKVELEQILSGHILKDKQVQAPSQSSPNIGYLLFEKPDGQPDFVSAGQLGQNLHRHQVSLIILSACQTAALGDNDEPMGSVAARLTAAGIPGVLAMTHSVLVHTTRTLFGVFYKELVRGHGIGEALDNARRHLVNHPQKYEVRRGKKRVWLKLHDWFLPALYESGADVPLLEKVDGSPAGQARPKALTNLPEPKEGGFFGRRRELWEIERWFADTTRRITITGFGGQGKTALALEAGRWLTRTGLFEAAAFVDYSRVQARDAVAVAKNEIGSVLGETLLDADAATEALKKTPTLVILDNLEALAPEALHALLEAAVPWSQAGGSRVLCTTRKPTFDHADYKVEGTNVHRRIRLDGLGSKKMPDDALQWCTALMALGDPPTVDAPEREALIELFDRVRFHPLSIRVLAQQLKTRNAADLGEQLEKLLATAGPTVAGIEDTPASLLASLELSLDRLDEAARKALPRLGVFQGGAMEADLLAITGLGESDQREQIQGILTAVETGDPREILRAIGLDIADDEQIPAEVLTQIRPDELRRQAVELRKQLAQMPAPSGQANLWPALRRQLEAAALIEAEDLPGVAVPFLRFHPTLAPMLWAQLDQAERTRLTAAHRERYHALSGYLYQQDRTNPHQARAIAWRELPNLLTAVHAALDAGDTDAGTFVTAANLFLDYFGLKQEAEALLAKAQAAAGEPGSDAWVLAQSNRGEQLLDAGQAAEAQKVFEAILDQLGQTPTYERAMTLGRLGRCFSAAGRPDLAAMKAADAMRSARSWTRPTTSKGIAA